MSRPLRILITPALSALIAVVALSGCGGSGNGGGSSDPAAVLGATFSNKKPIKSGRLDLQVNIRGASVAGLPSPFHLGLGGPFASASGGGTPKFQFDLAVGTSAGELSIGTVSTGDHGWLQIAGKAFTLPDSAFAGLKTQKSSSSSSGLQLSSLGVDPRRWLTSPKVVGTEDLAGDRVTHVSSGVDVPRLLDDLGNVLGNAGKLGLNGVAGVGSALSPSARAKLQKAITSAHVDVWTGEEDRLLRRLRVDAAVTGTDGAKGTLRLQLSLSALNRPQPIGPPANPRPLSELTSALGALAATRGAGTGSSGASGAQPPAPAQAPQTPATTTPAQTPQTYDACITQAGSNLARAQACASLLGK